MCAGCYLYFLIGNLTQNVYNGNFLNVSNELMWQMLETKNLPEYFIINWFLQSAAAC